jgi:hypothetical protein
VGLWKSGWPPWSNCGETPKASHRRSAMLNFDFKRFAE